MESKQDGGSAFPRSTYDPSGMSLRDWFAGQALCGMIAAGKTTSDFDTAEDALQRIDTCARGCYAWADAMLKAREQ